MKPDPFRDVDDEARNLARKLVSEARIASLGVLIDGKPYVSRILLSSGPMGIPHTLVSNLSVHTEGLRKGNLASLLVGEPGEKGDPLTHPRLTITVKPEFIDKATSDYAIARDQILNTHKKTALYADFADFNIVRLSPLEGHLNAGFGRAYKLEIPDILQSP